MKFRLGGQSLAVIALAGLVCVVAGLRWLGRNAEAIGAGIGTLVKVGVLLLIVAGMGIAARWLYAAFRRPAEEPGTADAPPPVRVASEQVPFSAAEEPRALLSAGEVQARIDSARADLLEVLARVLDNEEGLRHITRGDDHDE